MKNLTLSSKILFYQFIIIFYILELSIFFWIFLICLDICSWCRTNSGESILNSGYETRKMKKNLNICSLSDFLLWTHNSSYALHSPQHHNIFSLKFKCLPSKVVLKAQAARFTVSSLWSLYVLSPSHSNSAVIWYNWYIMIAHFCE